MSAVENLSVTAIAVRLIDPSPHNRRLFADDPNLAELAGSIQAAGLINPITLRPHGDGRFEIVCGERRWRAAMMLAWEMIPAVVKEMDDRVAQILRITENIQRQELNFLEEAEGVAALLPLCGGDYAEAGDTLGYNEAWARRRAKLLDLSDKWREAITDMDSPYAQIGETVGKLEEIARLPRETQDALLKSGAFVGHIKTVADMKGVIKLYCRDLNYKPWSREWEKKCVSGRRRCDACHKRSDREQTLFSDLADMFESTDNGGAVKLCLDAECWQNRIVSWCKYVAKGNPGVSLVWDGDCSYQDRKNAERAMGVDVVPGYAWRDRETEGFTVAAKGLFVGGARVGKTVDIWVREACAAVEFDRKVVDRHQEKESDWEEEEKRVDALYDRINAVMPAEAMALQQASGWGAFTFAAYLLNWAAWYGIGSIDMRDCGAMDVTDVASGSCPGMQEVWTQVREDIVDEVVAHIDGKELVGNAAAVVATLCGVLGVSLNALADDHGRHAFGDE